MTIATTRRHWLAAAPGALLVAGAAGRRPDCPPAVRAALDAYRRAWVAYFDLPEHDDAAVDAAIDAEDRLITALRAAGLAGVVDEAILYLALPGSVDDWHGLDRGQRRWTPAGTIGRGEGHEVWRIPLAEIGGATP